MKTIRHNIRTHTLFWRTQLRNPRTPILALALCIVLCGVVASFLLLRRPLSLKQVFADDFRIGVAVSTSQVMGDEPRALDIIQQQFNSITSENLLKWESVHPAPDIYDFEPVDRFVEFGEKNGMFIVGHTLIWYQQTPAWVFQDATGGQIDREGLLARMREHIYKVVGRYKGRIKAWDVVNEAVQEDGSLRQTQWLEIIGNDYVEKAFQYAHEADPVAELYYNDYDERNPAVRKGVCELVQNLQRTNVRLDGVGCQGHWGLDYPTDEEIDALFQDYGRLGVKLMLTELDINICKQNSDRNPWAAAINKTAKQAGGALDSFPPELKNALAQRYARIFQLLLKHREKVGRVTFWGVHDGQSWYNDYPMPCRAPYPLLFDRMYRPKLAFDAVIETGQNDSLHKASKVPLPLDN